MVVGMCIELLVGVGLGLMGVVSLPLRVSMGMLIDLTAGLCFGGE